MAAPGPRCGGDELDPGRRAHDLGTGRQSGGWLHHTFEGLVGGEAVEQQIGVPCIVRLRSGGAVGWGKEARKSTEARKGRRVTARGEVGVDRGGGRV